MSTTPSIHHSQFTIQNFPASSLRNRVTPHPILYPSPLTLDPSDLATFPSALEDSAKSNPLPIWPPSPTTLLTLPPLTSNLPFPHPDHLDHLARAALKKPQTLTPKTVTIFPILSDTSP